MDVAGKSVEQQRWILERIEDDKLAKADLLPLETLGLGKFAELRLLESAASEPSCMPDV
jgi:hypothetical protein